MKKHLPVCTILILLLFTYSASAAKYGSWNFRISLEGPKQAAAYTEEISSGRFPFLTIRCSEDMDKSDGFTTYLYSGDGFNTINPFAVPVSVSLDGKANLNLEWFLEGDAIAMVQSRWLIKDMLNGQQLLIKIDLKNGRKEYKFNLNGLEKSLENAALYCGFDYTGKPSSN